MKKLKIAFLIVLYLASVVFSFGVLNATDRYEAIENLREYRGYRKDLSADIFVSLLPGVNAVVAFAISGIAQDGWTLKIRPWETEKGQKAEMPQGPCVLHVKNQGSSPMTLEVDINKHIYIGPKFVVPVDSEIQLDTFMVVCTP